VLIVSCIFSSSIKDCLDSPTRKSRDKKDSDKVDRPAEVSEQGLVTEREYLTEEGGEGRSLRVITEPPR